MDLAITLLNDFSDDEKEMFKKNFTLYIKYDQHKDFVIDFDDVYQWIGFSTKGHAKRMLERSFEKDKDYTLFKYPLTKSGRTKDNIMLTPFAFKDYCMRASTKRGRNIHMYYLHLEDSVNMQVSEQLKLEFDKYKITAQDKIKALEAKFMFGDTMYILMERCGRTLRFKIGSSDNMNEREVGYYCHSTNYAFVYTRMCRDCKVLEDAMHFRFSTSQYMDREDWFVTGFEELRNALDTLQLALDGTASTFTIDEEAIKTALNAVQDDAPMPMPTNVPAELEPPSDDESEVDPSKEELDDKPDEAATVEEEPTTVQEPLPHPAMPDFIRFLEECYEKDPDSKTCWVELGARCRLWLRSTEQFKDQLSAFLKENGFKETYIYDEKTKTNYKAYAGLRMKPLPTFKITKRSSEIERFVYETCSPNATGRVPCKDLASAYEVWKRCALSKNVKKDMNKFFNAHFFASTVHDGTRIRFGFYGVSLKGNEAVGMKMKPRNRKSVEQLDATTMAVIRTYDSITHAAAEMGASISMISVAISANKTCKGYKFQKSEGTHAP